MDRWGITFPLQGLPLLAHREILQEAEKLGYTDAWTAEVDGGDAFVPIASAAAWTKKLRFGTAIANIYTRTPTLLALSTSATAEAAPGRFCLGLGSSSPAIVERWNGVPLKRPLRRMREIVAFLRQALTGQKTTAEAKTFKATGVRLSRTKEGVPPIFIGALREKMLRLAGEVGDGAILNWLSPSDVAKVVPIAKAAAKEAGKNPDEFEFACRIFVIPTEDENVVRMLGRYIIAGYLTTPVYYPFHEWLGRGEALRPMMEAWKAGERQDALSLVPDEVIHDILVFGDRKAIVDKVRSYVENGVTTPVMAIIPTAQDPAEQAAQSVAAVRELIPS
ncbi:MAG: LLM class F420-dependent oxidoreductase [Chloroflexi bacterium]|nr:LLM class F420-dependent oxidoreductase [Chloroflexota bacterium]